MEALNLVAGSQVISQCATRIKNSTPTPNVGEAKDYCVHSKNMELSFLKGGIL
jgi:hypothetical protein